MADNEVQSELLSKSHVDKDVSERVPKTKKRVGVSRKRKGLSPIGKFLLAFWGAVILFVVLVCTVPSWKAKALLKVWSANQWKEDHWAHQKLKEGGGAVVDVLTPYLHRKIDVKPTPYGPMSIVTRTLIELGDDALPALWELASSESEHKHIQPDYIYGVLKSSKAPGLRESVIEYTKNEDSEIRRIAIQISCTLLDVRKKEWLKDTNDQTAAFMMSYYIDDIDSVTYAIERKGPVLEAMFIWAIRYNIELVNIRDRVKNAKDKAAGNVGILSASDKKLIKRLEKAESRFKPLNDLLWSQRTLFKKAEGANLARYVYWLSMQPGIKESDILFIESLITHSDEDVRYRVISQLIKLRGKKILPMMWPLALKDESYLVKQAAWKAIMKLPDASSLVPLREEMKKNADIMNDRSMNIERRKEATLLMVKYLKLLSIIGEEVDIAMVQPFIDSYDNALHKQALNTVKNMSDRVDNN